jgi:hypothetical protein
MRLSQVVTRSPSRQPGSLEPKGRDRTSSLNWPSRLSVASRWAQGRRDAKDPRVAARAPTGGSSAKAKATTKQTAAHEPVYSYQGLLEHLETITRSTCCITGTGVTFDKLAEPTPTERRVFELIGTPIPLRLR